MNLSKIQIWSSKSKITESDILKQLLNDFETFKRNSGTSPTESDHTTDFINVELKLSSIETNLLEIVKLRNDLKSVTDRFDSLINIITDAGNIEMEDLKKKILAVKPVEIRTIRQNIQEISSKVGVQELRFGTMQRILDNVVANSSNTTSTISQIKSELDQIQNKQLLVLNSLYTGSLYFVKFGDWGILHGMITITTDLISTYPVGSIDWDGEHSGFVMLNRTPIPFEIRNRNLYIIKDGYNSNRINYVFNNYIT
jgi:hypothetical protein